MRTRYSNEIVFTRSFLVIIGLSILLIVSGCGAPRRTANPGPGFSSPPSENNFPLPPFLQREEPVPDPNLSPIENQFEMLRTYKFGMVNPALDALEFFLDNIDDEEILAEMRIVAEGDDPFQRMFASFVLFKAGDEQEKRVDVFIEGMETMMGDEIRCAHHLAQQLLVPGDDPVFIGKFLELQSHSNPWNRETVVMLASQFPDVEGVREFLLDSLNDERWEVRSPAVIALGEVLSSSSVYPNDPEIINQFYDLLDDDNVNVSSNAFEVLSRFISVREILELISEIMNVDSESVPSEVYDLLINLVPSDEVNQFLVERIDENNVSLTTSILGIIGRRGENAATAAPVLIELLNPESSSGDLVVVLPRDDTFLMSLLWALACIGPAAEDAVPILGSMLRTDFDLTNREHPDYDITSRIIFALSKIGGQADEYLPVIVDVARESYGRLRINAIDAMGILGEQTESWVPEFSQIAEELKNKRGTGFMEQPINPAFLEPRISYDDSAVINRIHIALYRIGYEPDVQLEFIIAELEGPDFLFAVKALGEIGTEASEALPRLHELAEYHEDVEEARSLRHTILEAIDLIEPSPTG